MTMACETFSVNETLKIKRSCFHKLLFAVPLLFTCFIFIEIERNEAYKNISLPVFSSFQLHCQNEKNEIFNSLKGNSVFDIAHEETDDHVILNKDSK